MNPYDIVTHDGKRVDALTKAALMEAEELLGYELSITQGSYNAGGVSASAGTHDGGGVVDLRAWDWENKVRALRRVGFAAWYRSPSEGPWSAHIHAVLIGNERLAPSAQRQVEAYYAGRNGLANNGPDTFWRPDPIPVFAWERDTRGAHIDAALRHIGHVRRDADEDSGRYILAGRAARALRSIPQRKTTSKFEDTMPHRRRSETRGPHVDYALNHINRALRIPRRKKVRDALLKARHNLLLIPSWRRR